MGIIISTDRLVSASEARSKLGKLIDEINEDEGKYFVILENGKVAALLVHPHFLHAEGGESFPDLEKLRREWTRYTKEISGALERLEKMDKEKIPPLLR